MLLFVAAQPSGWYPYPTLALPAVAALPLAACLLLFAPVVTWRSRA
jgi:hypothetical protein